jgi:UDP-glucose 4-epimerase
MGAGQITKEIKMNLKGKNVLVTGGAGFIGSNLVDCLIRQEPANLMVVDNFFLGDVRNLAEARQKFPALKVQRIDAGDLAAMQQLTQMEKAEVIFDLAVIPLPTSLTYPSWTLATNIAIATTCCELAKAGYIETLIHCSSSEAYGSALYSAMDEAHPLVPTTPYAASKAAADQIVISYCQTFNIDAAITRPFNNFGPRQNAGSYAGIIPIVISRVKKGLPIEIYGDGLQTRDYIFVRHTAEAIIKVYETAATRGRVINIATGYEITINDLVARMLQVMGVPDHPVIHTDPRPGDVRRHRGDISLLKELTGYTPQPISDEDLRKTVDWYWRQL